MSIFADSKMGLPLSIVSTRPNSSARCISRSAARMRIRPRWRGFMAAQGPDAKALLAAATARSRSSRAASATSAMVSPVAGFVVANRFPDADGTNSPSMKRSVRRLSFGVTSVAISRRLFPFELRDSLLLVGRDAFLGVLALEEELLELPLDRERGFRRKVPAGLDRALDPADRLRGLVGRDELASVVHDLLPPLRRRGVDDLIDEAHLEGLLEREGVAGDHELDRLRLADGLGEARRAARSRQDAQRDLRQADLAGVLAGDAQVRGHRDLEAAADRVAVQGGDDELGRVLEAQERLVGVQAEEVLEARRDGVEHPDVGAGREETVALAPQDDHVDVVVETRLQDRVVELPHKGVGVGI